MFHHRGHTRHALVMISVIESLWTMFAVMSLGSSSQFSTVVLSPSTSFSGLEHDAIMQTIQLNLIPASPHLYIHSQWPLNVCKVQPKKSHGVCM